MMARRKHRDDVTATILASIALMFGGMALLTIGILAFRLVRLGQAMDLIGSARVGGGAG